VFSILLLVEVDGVVRSHAGAPVGGRRSGGRRCPRASCHDQGIAGVLGERPGEEEKRALYMWP
jgi:hypothetical protein